MITVEDLSLDNLRARGRTDFNYQFVPGVILDDEGYFIDTTPPYSLVWINLGTSIQLESGATVRFTGSNSSGGYMIFKQSPDGDYLIGVAYYPMGQGIYSQAATPSYKETVVNAYNSYLEDEGEATTENVGERVQSLNERGETVREERERLQREAEEAERQRREDETTPINEEEEIFNNTYVFNLEGSNLVRELPMRIIQVTTGTVAEPIVSYRVEEYSSSEGTLQGSAVWSETSQTQEAAEIILQNYVDSQRDDYNVEAEASKAAIAAKTPKLEQFTNYKIYFEESNISFQEALLGEFDSETSPLYKRYFSDGPYGDAAVFTNGGDTLELDDFDTPRITGEGITANPSGAVGFTVRQNWRVTFELTTDSSLTFIERGVVDGVSKQANTFTFTMYAGDRLELDIDNERPEVRPFLVMIQGREWFSAEEVDDEISLTMVKAEKLMVDFEQGTEYILPSGEVLDSDLYPREITSSYVGPVYGPNVPLSSSNWMGEVRDTPEYNEAQYVDRRILSQNPGAESSFIGQEEVGGQIVGAAEDVIEGVGDVAGSFFDRFKWWILGGVIVIGIFIYINARGRSGASPVGGE